jgi:hypothetical protein
VTVRRQRRRGVGHHKDCDDGQENCGGLTHFEILIRRDDVDTTK